ncbi:MAG: DUF1456 family protein [Gammaproteobacteria bacterium]|nr:DUF1456 family protein [Gammaproteobacteria bacterium]
MLYKSYGTISALLRTIPLWKDEGYAEYVAHQGEFPSKAELLKLIETDHNVAQRLMCPFSALEKYQYMYQDYQAALIQVRYALDFKKTDLNDFFKNSYILATSEEIIEWLHRPEEINYLSDVV